MVLVESFKVNSPNVKYEKEEILSEYIYRNTAASINNDQVVISPVEKKYTFKTNTKVPKLGYIGFFYSDLILYAVLCLLVWVETMEPLSSQVALLTESKLIFISE